VTRPTRQSPLERYQADLLGDDFVLDVCQERVVAKIQALYQQLVELDSRPPPNLLERLSRRKAKAPRGLYLWGGVGRGKTYLMDCFYDCLPLESKRRVHFHHFMQDVHDGLREHRNQADPLQIVAQELTGRSGVLCFDEFHVSDIADAMLLAGLLETLFAGGLTLIATSNIEPDALYKDGLQRAKFLPAIEQLKQHTDVINVDGGVDYRLRILERAEIYHCPLGELANSRLERSFHELAPGECREKTTLHINHRELAALGVTEGIGWFEFAVLCEQPRSSNDYIELARRFNTLLISNVPQMHDGSNDPARRFINLVDEIYDRNVNLILSAATRPKQLYTGERLAFEFRRTISRLTEMQTHDYLASEHQP
jgi:cell division protein ZapE